MEYRNGRCGEQVPDGVRNLYFQNPGVPQSPSVDLPTGAPHASGHALDSKEVVRRICCRGGRDKQSVTAAKIDLERRRVAVDGLEIQWRKLIRRDEFGAACYGGWSGGHVE